MDNKRTKIALDFTLSFSDITEINHSFATAHCAIAYAGRNRNKSDIAKEVFEAALPSLKNCPIVANYSIEQGTLGGHDMKVTHDSDGKLVLINYTHPIGVIPESASQYWKEVDGVEYLCTDMLLWKRQPAYQYFLKNHESQQSMEISVGDDFHIDDDGYMVVEAFEFEALCAIGVKPCFEQATIQLYSQDASMDYKQQFSQMLNDLKQLSDELSTKVDFSNKSSKEGGMTEMGSERINEILAEFGLSTETVSFEIDENISETELRLKLKNQQFCDEAHTFAITARRKRDVLQSALPTGRELNDDGEVISYVAYDVLDYDDVYVYVEECNYSVAKGYESCIKRRKYTFNDEDNSAVIDSDGEECVRIWVTLEEEAARNMAIAELEEYRNSHSTADAEVEELRKYRDEHIAMEHKAAIDAVLANFDDIADNEAFVALTNTAYTFEVADLEKECNAIRGKMLAPQKFAVAHPRVVIPHVDDSSDDELPYGGCFEKFLNK